jgi:DNA repair exonuclease SbcCD ATPase subunit
MDTYSLKPENMRAPAHLNAAEIQKSLEELDSKIKVLQAKTKGTTADSQHTFHEHIAALEAKRALIAQKLDNSENATESTWSEIKKHVEELTESIKKLF